MKNISKVGLESSKHYLDTLSSENISKGINKKISQFEVVHTQNSILAIITSGLNNSENEFVNYIHKKLNEKLQNNPKKNLIKNTVVNLLDEEFIEKITTIVDNSEGSNESEINGIKIKTNLKEYEFGINEKILDSNQSYKKVELGIEKEFIIGLKTTYEYKINKELDTSLPYLTFIKIYTDADKNKGKYYKVPLGKKIWKYAKYLLYFLMIILFSALRLSFYYYSSQNILKGVIYLDANNEYLTNPTQIHTDEHGFIHIKADNRLDAFFTVGIAQARDRIFQMDFMRRLTRGKLAEVLGEKAVRIDKFMRNIGINHIVEKDYEYMKNDPTQKEEFEALEKYAEGVNFYALEFNNYLPPEYYLLRFKFEKWNVTDSMAIVRFMTYSMGMDWHIEIFNHVMQNTLDEKFFEHLYNVTYKGFPFYNYTVVDEEELTEVGLGIKNLHNHKENKPKQEEQIIELDNKENKEEPVIADNLLNSHASNSWVIHGNYTESGKPIFSNDPHLSNSIPPIHYIVKYYIKTDGVMSGSTLIGTPILLFGANSHITWGFTTDNRDTSDLCEEKVNFEENTYIYDNQTLKLTIREEEIKVKGKEQAEKYIIKSTGNGPIIDKFLSEFSPIGIKFKYTDKKANRKAGINDKANALSLRNYQLQLPFNNLGSFNMMFAKSKEEFLPLFEENSGPLLALSWAHVNGEIGYTPIGKVPLKDYKESRFVKGYLSSSAIKSHISRKVTPVIINPKKGFIVTANNRQLPDNYIHYVQSFAYFNRFYRISKLIANKISEKKIDVNDNIDIVYDALDEYCAVVLPKIISILERNINNDNILTDLNKKYLIMLKEFDYRFLKNSSHATLYSVFEFNFAQNLLVKKNNDFGFENINEAKGVLNIFNYWNFIADFIDKIYNNEKIEIENCNFYKSFGSCEGYIVESFLHLDEYLADFKDSKGEIVTWGDVHHNYYPHALDKSPIASFIFSRKSPSDGNRNTVKVSKNKFHDEKSRGFGSFHSANFKIITDLSDISRPYITLDTGNRGNILSKFYNNLMDKNEAREFIMIKDHVFNDGSEVESKTLIIKNK